MADRRTFTLNGTPLVLSLDGVIEPSVGVVDASYRITGTPGAMPADSDHPGCIIEAAWEKKNHAPMPGGAASIYELARRDYEAVVFGHGPGLAATGRVSVRGTSSRVLQCGSIVAATSGVAPTGTMAVSETTYRPAGPGLISFTTVHLLDGVPVGEANGDLVLKGSPEAMLPEEFSVRLSLQITRDDTDPSDGLLGGRLVGTLEALP